jgi:hypothetical protein
MPSQMETIRDDLAYLRALAEGRRDAVLGGAAPLISAAAIFSAASIFGYAVSVRRLGLPLQFIGWGFIAAAVLHTLVLLVLGHMERARHGRPAAETPTHAAWQAVRLAALTLMAAFFITSWRMQSAQIWTAMPIIVFALYGAAWSVAAAASRKAWPRWVSAGAFAACLLTAAFSGRPEQLLVFAVGLTALGIIPGLVIARRSAA